MTSVTRTIKKLFFVFLTILPLASVMGPSWMMTTGCGSLSASAPPVSIPAPVAGSISVTSPDEEGVALVVGDESAVEGGSLVQAINETQSTSATLWLSSLVTSAFAQVQGNFPDICSRPFHACAFAEDDGSFEIEINASEDDEISVGVIDETTGEETSVKISRPVPQNIRHFVLPVMDVQVLPDQNELYALIQAPLVEIDSPFVSILNLDTNEKTPVPIPGTDPKKLRFSPQRDSAVILDGNGNFAAVSNLQQKAFNNPTATYEVQSPTDVIYHTSGQSIVVSSGKQSKTLLTKISLDANQVVDTVTEDEVTAGNTTHDTTLAMDAISYSIQDAAGGVITSQFIATIMAFNNAGQLMTGVAVFDYNLFQAYSAITEFPEGTEPDDVAFYPDGNMILVTDFGNDTVLMYSYTFTPEAQPPITLNFLGSVSDPNEVLPDGILKDPRDIVVDSAGGRAFVTARNHTEETPDMVVTIDLATRTVVQATPIGLDPTGIIWDSQSSTVYVSTAKTRAVTFWGLDDLIP